MKTILLALTSISVLAASCSKSDDSSGGVSVSMPNLNLVAPNFKNTAKNGAEVASHLNETSTATSAVKFGTKPAMSSGSSNSILKSGTVERFLAGDHDPDFGSDNFDFNSTVGSDCASSLKVLNTIYSQTSSALKTTADALVNLDNGQLPEGIVKEQASEEFAVSYAVDLSKVKIESSSKSTSPAEQPNMSGLLRIGAGSNDEVAVVGLGFNGLLSGQEGGSSAVNGGLSVAAYSKQKMLKLNTNSTMIASARSDDGQVRNASIAIDSTATLVAGSNPAIELILAGKGNMMLPANDGMNRNGNQPIIDGNQHTTEAQIKLEKLANDDVSLSLSIKTDGKGEKKDLVLTTDQNGRCVVKQPAIGPSVASVK